MMVQYGVQSGATGLLVRLLGETSLTARRRGAAP